MVAQKQKETQDTSFRRSRYLNTNPGKSKRTYHAPIIWIEVFVCPILFKPIFTPGSISKGNFSFTFIPFSQRSDTKEFQNGRLAQKIGCCWIRIQDSSDIADSSNHFAQTHLIALRTGINTESQVLVGGQLHAQLLINKGKDGKNRVHHESP